MISSHYRSFHNDIDCRKCVSFRGRRTDFLRNKKRRRRKELLIFFSIFKLNREGLQKEKAGKEEYRPIRPPVSACHIYSVLVAVVACVRSPLSKLARRIIPCIIMLAFRGTSRPWLPVAVMAMATISVSLFAGLTSAESYDVFSSVASPGGSFTSPQVARGSHLLFLRTHRFAPPRQGPCCFMTAMKQQA